LHEVALKFMLTRSQLLLTLREQFFACFQLLLELRLSRKLFFFCTPPEQFELSLLRIEQVTVLAQFALSIRKARPLFQTEGADAILFHSLLHAGGLHLGNVF